MAGKLGTHDIWPLAKETFSQWMEDKVPKMAAALAYYTAISIAPLLVITIKVLGMMLGPKAASHQLQGELASLTDPRIADALQGAIEKAGAPGAGTWATIISIIVALFGASGVFAELQDSLNTIWEVRPKPNRGIMGMIRDRFLSITMVLGVAFLLLVSMFISTMITGVSGMIMSHILGKESVVAHAIAIFLDICISTAVVSVLFAAIFKMLPDVEIDWPDVGMGALVTAILFQIGKYGLGIYLTKATPESAYGVAGSLVAVLIWVYYSSQILFFGAEFTKVYADEYGSRIVPSKNAEPLPGAKVVQPFVDRPATV